MNARGGVAAAIGALTTVATAALLGSLAAALLGLPPLGGVVVAVALVAAVAAWRRARRTARLLDWLREPHGHAAPRDDGAWGEIAYRVEKLLRGRDLLLAQADERLARFFAAIEASPNGVLLLDAGDHVDWCNAVAAAHFGLDPQRDRGQRVTNLVRAPAFVAHLQTGVDDRPVQFPAPGRNATLAVWVRPYGGGMKLVLSQDVTERERSDAMRRDFVANVSHEIRSPLTVLAGYVETLGALPLAGAERERVLASMARQTARIQLLVSDLLALAELEGSPPPPTDAWFDLQPLLQRLVADARALSGGRHPIDGDDAATANGVALAGSDAEFASAVGNLLHNAVRYTPDGGRIALRWRRLGGGGGEIEVGDEGIGIAREHLPRLTERFYRVDQSRSRATGGTGLGLSIVKHVLQRHGGEVLVDSEPGRGSVFRLRLPPARVRQGAAVDAGGVGPDAAAPLAEVAESRR